MPVFWSGLPGYQSRVLESGDVQMSGLGDCVLVLKMCAPQWKFMDMASCCLLACIVAAIFLAAMIFGWVMRDFVKKA